jgi:hypothetical protein
MGHQSICVPGAPRRRSRWYVKLRQAKHLYVWIGLLAALVLLFGYGIVKFVKQSSDDETDAKYRIKITPIIPPQP